MSKASSLFLALTLGSGLFLGGCTVDAQLASSLLNSLKGKIEDNTDADGKVNLTAKDLSEAADEAGVRIVCGGEDMTIASLDEDEDADEDEVIEDADYVHPVMLGYGPGGPRGGYAQRIQIDISLGQELGRLNQFRGAERDMQYRKIQQRYPQMAKARPIPVKGGSSKEIVFGEFCGCEHEHGMTQSRPASAGARPAMAYAGKPAAGGYFMPGRRAGYAHPMPPIPAGYEHPMPPIPAGEATAAVPARRVAWHGMPIEGFKNAKGQPCELLSQSDDANEDDESDSQDSSDDNEDEDED